MQIINLKIGTSSMKNNDYAHSNYLIYKLNFDTVVICYFEFFVRNLFSLYFLNNRIWLYYYQFYNFKFQTLNLKKRIVFSDYY